MRIIAILVALLIPASMPIDIAFAEYPHVNVTRDLTKVFESEPTYANGLDWDDYEYIRMYMDSDTNIKLVLITMPNCSLSYLVHRRIRQEKLRDNIVIAKGNEQWVVRSLQNFGETKLPVLVVYDKILVDKSYIISNIDDIIPHIKYWAAQKNLP